MQGRQRRRNVFGFGGAADECMVGKNQCPEKHIVHICSRKCIFISVMLKLMGFPGKYWGGAASNTASNVFDAAFGHRDKPNDHLHEHRDLPLGERTVSYLLL